MVNIVAEGIWRVLETADQRHALLLLLTMLKLETKKAAAAIAPAPENYKNKFHLSHLLMMAVQAFLFNPHTKLSPPELSVLHAQYADSCMDLLVGHSAFSISTVSELKEGVEKVINAMQEIEHGSAGALVGTGTGYPHRSGFSVMSDAQSMSYYLLREKFRTAVSESGPHYP